MELLRMLGETLLIIGYGIGLAFVLVLWVLGDGILRGKQGGKKWHDVKGVIALLCIWVMSPILELLLIVYGLTILIPKGFRKLIS